MKTFSSIADVVSTARKDRRLSQEQVAEALGVHQATYSRIENNLSIPTITQWDDLCRVLAIPYDSGRYKLIDRLNSLSEKTSRASIEAIPEKYRSGSRMKVRYLLPLINYVYNSRGEEAFQETIEKLGFEKSFFVNIDHELNALFLNDILNTLDYGKNAETILGEISELVGRPECHASLAETYQRATTKAQLLGSFVENQQYYQPFYTHRLSSDKKGVRIAIEHEPKVREALLELPYKTLLFMREYALLSLREMAQFQGRSRERGVRSTIIRSDDMLNPGMVEVANG